MKDTLHCNDRGATGYGQLSRLYQMNDPNVDETFIFDYLKVFEGWGYKQLSTAQWFAVKTEMQMSSGVNEACESFNMPWAYSNKQ